MFKLLSIDDMICQSIIAVSNPELRKRLANAILIVGGGSKFKGMIDYLEDRLFEKLTVLDNQLERVEIINYPNVDMKTISWIGATIIPKLDSSKDMWILRDRWLGELEKTEDLNINKDPINNLTNLNLENLNVNNSNLNGVQGNSSIVNFSNNNMSNNINDNMSGFKQESVKDKEKEKEKEKEKPKKKERLLDGGPKLIREKCPFQW